MEPPVNSLLPTTGQGLPHHSNFTPSSASPLRLPANVAAVNRQHTWPNPEPCRFASKLATPASFETNPEHSLAHRVLAYHAMPPSSSRARIILLPDAQECQPSLFTVHGGGVLDSPLVMRRESLVAYTPISPPPTLPSTTLALPATDSTILAPYNRDRLESLASESPTEPCQGGGDGDDDDGRPLSHMEGPGLNNGHLIGIPSPQLLSPLSPKWEPARTSNIEQPSPLLVGLSRQTIGMVPVQVPFQPDQTSEKWNSPPETVSQSSSGLPSPSFGLILELDGQHMITNFGDPTFLFSDSQYCHAPETDVNLSLWDSTLSFSPLTQATSILAYPGPHRTSDTDDSTWPTRPILPPLDIPEAYHTQSQTAIRTPRPADWPSPKTNHLTSDDDREDESAGIALRALPFNQPDVDALDELPISTSFPLTQPNLCVISDESQTFTPTKHPNLSPPAPLSLEDLIIPDTDDNGLSLVPPTQSPSPSRRSFTSLPVIDPANDFPLPFSASNPSHPLRTLPGADTDDDLVPPDLSSPSFCPELTPSLSTSLLLIHDPNDIPRPRSPSPENFDLDVSLDETTDPVLQRLCIIRKRANAAEHAAWVLEVQMLEQGKVHLRAEARRVRKREKERSRETGALLQLKLCANVQPQASRETGSIVGPKKLISSLPQLVARMMFRRHESFRPLANRKLAGTLREYVASPLSQSATANCDGADPST